MAEKRFTCETKTQGSVSIDLMKDNGQIIEKFEAINLLNELHEENRKLKQYNQQITKVLEDGGVILTKNQLNSLIEMKNDDSVEVRYLKTANAKLKDEIRALKEYMQK